MARDGSGNYSRVVTPPSNGDVADADDFNAEINDIATALSDSINRSGTKAFAADQSMGGYKLTNLAAPTNANDAARKTYVDTAISALSSSYQPLDATLTALAALSYTSGNLAVTMTGADTFALSTFGTAAGQNTGTSGATVPLLNGGNTYSGSATFSSTFSVANALGTTATFSHTSGSPTVVIQAFASGSQAALQYNTSTTSRWILRKTSAAESGANAGSNFEIAARDDSGAAIGAALSIARATMASTFGGVVFVPAGSAAAPSLSFSGDPDTGFYSEGGNSFLATANGAARWRFSLNTLSGANGSSNIFQSGDGSASTPSIGFVSDTNTGFYRIGADNVGLALNGTKYVDWATTGTAFVAPVNARVSSSSETTGTLTIASANDEIHATGDITIPASVFVQYDKIRIYAGASARTITQGGGLTQRLGGTSTTGNLTLAARGWALVEFISATECTVSGDVS